MHVWRTAIERVALGAGMQPRVALGAQMQPRVALGAHMQTLMICRMSSPCNAPHECANGTAQQNLTESAPG